MARRERRKREENDAPATAEDGVSGHRERFWRFVSWLLDVLPTATIWSVFFVLIWLLRDFFSLIFVTFVFAFASTSLTRALGRAFPRLGWKPRVVAVFLCFLLAWTLFGWLFVPQIKAGAVRIREVAQDFPGRWRRKIEPEFMEKNAWYRGLLERLDPEFTGTEKTDGAAATPEADAGSEGAAGASEATRAASPRGLLQLPLIQSTLPDVEEWLIEKAPAAISRTLTAAVSLVTLLFLSTLFSFLVVFDLQGLRREVEKLEATRLSHFYRETGANIVKFGEILGKVLEAQAVIALVNALLTAIGLWFFDVPHVAFLSIIVFVCGFVPVAGVFVSSAPICLIGLYHGGVGQCVLLVLLITGIHFLEAYVLNPRIMGATLKINPVLVLVILVIGHHAFGVWGLLLGLPLCYYFFTHVITREDRVIGLGTRRRQKPAA